MNTTPTDIAANKHGGNAESVSAHQRLKATKKAQMRKVYNSIKAAGLNGLTCLELAEVWDVAPNVISGRFSELKADGLIEKTGRRGNSGVCVAVELMPSL